MVAKNKDTHNWDEFAQSLNELEAKFETGAKTEVDAPVKKTKVRTKKVSAEKHNVQHVRQKRMLPKNWFPIIFSRKSL